MKVLLKALVACLTFAVSGYAFPLSITMTTAQKVRLTLPDQVTVLSVSSRWLDNSCTDVVIQFPSPQVIYIVSGSEPCVGKLLFTITGTVSGNTRTVDDVVDVTITTSRPVPAALTASAPEPKP